MQVQPTNIPTATVPQIGNDAAEAARQALAALVSGGSLELLTLVGQATDAPSRTQPRPTAPELAEPFIEFDGDSMALLLQRLQHQTAQLQENTAMEFIKVNQEKLKTKNEEHVAKLVEAQEAQAKAEADAAKSWWGRLFKTIAGALLTAICTIASVAMAVGTFGAATALTVVVLAIAAIVLYDSIVDIVNFARESCNPPLPPWDWGSMQALSKGVATLLKGMGVNEFTANLIGTIYAACYMICLIIVSALAGNAASAATRMANIGQQAAKVAETGAKVAETVSKLEAWVTKLQTLVSAVEITLGLISAGGTAWSGAWNIQKALDQLDADNANVDALAIKQILAKLQYVLQEQQEEIAKIIEALEDSDLAIVRMLSSNAQTRQQIAYNIA